MTDSHRYATGLSLDRYATGLSLDDRPVQPVQQGERWVCPIDGDEVLRCPHGTWHHKASEALLAGLDCTQEEWLCAACPVKAEESRA